MADLVKKYQESKRKAWCLSCDAEPWQAQNAIAVAALHARAHRHRVWCEVSSEFTFTGVDDGLGEVFQSLGDDLDEFEDEGVA